MFAVVLRQHGDPARLTYEEVELPRAQAGEVRVRIKAAAVNRVDLEIRSGASRLPHELPMILGREAAGTVDEVGPDVSSSILGRRVVIAPIQPCWLCVDCLAVADNLCALARLPGTNVPGGYAQYAIAAASGVIALPPEVSFEMAAASLVSFGTAWRMAVTLGNVQAGEAVLVTGAAGGLGLAAVQVAKLRGAMVIAAAGARDHLDAAARFGADRLVDYRESDLASEVMVITEGRGVAVGIECVGGDVFEKTLASMARMGRLVVAGAHSGEVVAFDLIPFHRREIRMFGSRSQRLDEMTAALALVAEGKLVPTVGAVLPLADAPRAHALLEARAVSGKILLIPP